jgi:hypothetical protein
MKRIQFSDFMNITSAIFKIALIPVRMLHRIAIWITKQGWRLLCYLILLTMVSGCAGNSAKLDQSPCAGCDFAPVNTAASSEGNGLLNQVPQSPRQEDAHS